jgi:hypothetical protein
MAKMQFIECGEDVYGVMAELLNEYHSSLLNCKIKCLFYDKPRKRSSKIILATAEAVSAKYSYLTGLNFIISVYDEAWEVMVDQEKRALLDHELNHCFIGEDKDGEPVYKIIPHDVEDFRVIIDRYGAGWADNIYIEDDSVEDDD